MIPILELEKYHTKKKPLDYVNFMSYHVKNNCYK